MKMVHDNNLDKRPSVSVKFGGGDADRQGFLNKLNEIQHAANAQLQEPQKSLMDGALQKLMDLGSSANKLKHARKYSHWTKMLNDELAKNANGNLWRCFEQINQDAS